MSLPPPASASAQVVQHTPRDLFSLETPSSPGSKPQLPTLRVSALVRPLLVPKPRTPSKIPTQTSCRPRSSFGPGSLAVPPRSGALQGLTCWEQMGAGWSKSRGEARHGASPYWSSSNSPSPRGGSRRTRGRRHTAPMAPSTVAERAIQSWGRREGTPGPSPAQKSQLADFASGLQHRQRAGRAEGRASGWVCP